MDHQIEQTDTGNVRLLLSVAGMRVAVDATPQEMFRLAAAIMDLCYHVDETEQRYTLCERCASVIEVIEQTD